jgi:RNA 3'-terminal phosphate cyclase-like protein
MVDAARGVLNQLLADVYIFTDAAAGPAAGNSPGYGITLVAETNSGCLISAEAAATTVRRYPQIVVSKHDGHTFC